uniref:Uncharacterized protein n=1 Tax=Peronospora matthiolae TaxID=2874970 RepID=A0AAV1TFH8_9STRA
MPVFRLDKKTSSGCGRLATTLLSYHRDHSCPSNEKNDTRKRTGDSTRALRHPQQKVQVDFYEKGNRNVRLASPNRFERAVALLTTELTSFSAHRLVGVTVHCTRSQFPPTLDVRRYHLSTS